jgi:indolepyruvate ferredoxin oxidoreductase beta subunit
MTCDIIIAGVGGQGILSIATVIGRACLAMGWRLKQSEVHGMAQRGGAVQSHLRLADGPIHSDVISQGRADMILSMEPVEALRYLPWLARHGWLISNASPVVANGAYPPLAKVHAAIRALERHVLFDADAVARANSAPRSVNMAMLGAASPFLGIGADLLERAIAEQFDRKGAAVVAANIAVFKAARALAEARKGAG